MAMPDRWDRPASYAPPERPDLPPPEDRSDAHPANAAVATIVGVFGVLAAALIIALTFDVGSRGRSGTSWELKVTIAALGSSFGASTGGGTSVAVALLVALGLVRSARGARRRQAFLVGVGACAASLWLGIATALAIYVDFTLPPKLDGTVAGAVLGNVSTLVILGAAAAWGAATATSSR